MTPSTALLLAQAQSLGATFMTADEQVLAAGVAGVLDARTEGPGGT
nr:type II toxin-antitoxin system VapC family toxin [Serinicoccus marinus]